MHCLLSLTGPLPAGDRALKLATAPQQSSIAPASIRGGRLQGLQQQYGTAGHSTAEGQMQQLAAANGRDLGPRQKVYL